jgi:RNA polymerase sigma factor (sigma-70 family)
MTADAPSTGTPGDIFVTTRWTVVLAAGRKADPQAKMALEELCRIYWFPLYAYVRRHGRSKEEAEDLTQEFFARFLTRNFLKGLSAERGRFRAFLLASLKHFLANEWDKAQCQKRGGNITHLSLDWQTADTQFKVAATAEPSPDKAFDREWALALLARVIERLHAECAADGRAKPFEQLKTFLTVDRDELSYADAARALGMDEVAARVAVHRLRKRYRQLLRDEITQTLSDPAMVEEEMRALFGAFG